MQPASLIVTLYVPVAAAVALAIDGLRIAAVNPLGPVQLYVAPDTAVTSSCSVLFAQMGPLFVAVTVTVGQVTVVLPVPVIPEFSVSVAVIDCAPGVISVKPLVKVCAPASPPVKV